MTTSDMDELSDQDRLDLENVIASARLEGQEVSPATQALAIEFLAGRIDAETFRREVIVAALESKGAGAGVPP